ncbi:hypothetical protein CEUSTIGMA_g6074.t1 [Chlamydomonas eustigma]|uniref:Uncharacterized protein n=1 Tax=Chlamydomonas eustigma TaxID=1157962 RepID=A0A250X6G1_9CHLO|nr:hypothetical protein CEUSTIGMA_g6074.t1 [Chlamydomonas eustigma]|eukprot:GAX78636.1 hypothetical protein CEUSTIGMA_g6074.t1 [Chlamydomonas eustigma]
MITKSVWWLCRRPAVTVLCSPTFISQTVQFTYSKVKQTCSKGFVFSVASPGLISSQAHHVSLGSQQKKALPNAQQGTSASITTEVRSEASTECLAQPAATAAAAYKESARISYPSHKIIIDQTRTLDVLQVQSDLDAGGSPHASSDDVPAGRHDRRLQGYVTDDVAADLHTSLPTISPEVAYTVARKGRQGSITHMPQHLQEAFREAVADSGLRPSELRSSAQRLIRVLEEMSSLRSSSASAPGSTDYDSEASSYLDPNRVKGPHGSKRGSAAVDSLVSQLEHEGIGSMDAASLNAALGLPPPLKDETAELRAKTLTPSYRDRSQAAAYLIARSSGVHASLERVLQEVKAAELPGFKPSSVMEYGARAGCGVYALSQAWPGRVRSVMAVEPSTAMSEVGALVERAVAKQYKEREEAEESEKMLDGSLLYVHQSGSDAQDIKSDSSNSKRIVHDCTSGLSESSTASSDVRSRRSRGKKQLVPPRVNWVKSLPRIHEAPHLKRKFDLVVCSYSLDDATSSFGAKGRQDLVKTLWDMTGDVLVLIESGTPAGFAHIRSARAQILASESRRRHQILMGANQSRSQDVAESQGRGSQRCVAADVADSGSHDVGSADPGSPRQSALMDIDGNTAMKAKSIGAHVIAPCAHDGRCPMEGRRMWCHFSQRQQRPSFIQSVLPGARSFQDETFSYVVLRRGPRPEQVPEVAVSRLSSPTASPPRLSSTRSGWHVPDSVIKRQVLMNRILKDQAEQRSRQTAAAASGTSSSDRDYGRKQQLDTAEAEVTSDMAEPSLYSVPTGMMGMKPRPFSAAFEKRFPSYGSGLIDKLILAEEKGVPWQSSCGNDVTKGQAGLSREAADLASALRPDPAPRQDLSRISTTGTQDLLRPADSAVMNSDRCKTFESNKRDDLSTANTGVPDLDVEADIRLGHNGESHSILGSVVGTSTSAASASTEEESADIHDDVMLRRLQLEREAALMELRTAFFDSPSDGTELTDVHSISSKQNGRTGHISVTLESRSGVATSPDSQQQASGVGVAAPQHHQHSEVGHAAEHLNSSIISGLELDSVTMHELAVRSATRWPRLYRPPRVRGGHVILDLCAAEPAAGASPHEAGRLERHTVAKSDAASWMGQAGWKMAKEVEWGDLWPDWYVQGNRRRVKVLDPDSKEAQLRNSLEAEAREVAQRLRFEEVLKSYGLDDSHADDDDVENTQTDNSCRRH